MRHGFMRQVPLSSSAGIPTDTRLLDSCEGLGMLAQYQCEIDRLKRRLQHPTTSQVGPTPVMPSSSTEPTTYSRPPAGQDEGAFNPSPPYPLNPAVEPSSYGVPVARTGPPIMPPPPPPLIYPPVEPASYGVPVARTGPPIMPPPEPPGPPSSPPEAIEPSGYPVAPPPSVWCPEGQHYDSASRSCIPNEGEPNLTSPQQAPRSVSQIILTSPATPFSMSGGFLGAVRMAPRARMPFRA